MRSASVSTLAMMSVVVLSLADSASANIVDGPETTMAKWTWVYRLSSDPRAGTSDWGLGNGLSRDDTKSGLALKSGLIDERGRKAQTKLIRGGRVEERARVPITHQQLIGFRGSVADLGRGEDRPVGAPPGIFVNYVPDAAALSDNGGGTTVPLPPAFVLAALGLGIVGLARRFGWTGNANVG